MKIVVNADFGGFGYGVSKKYEGCVFAYENDRANPELVAFVENHPDDCGDLAIMTIPDNATDWDIQEYDGNENLIYVVNGKIHYCCEVDDDDCYCENE
mgnify:FL=1|jgi:hypothetical protein